MDEEFVVLWSKMQEDFPVVLNLSIKLAAAVCILIAGMIIASWIRKRLRKSKFGGSHVDSTLRPVIASTVFYVIIAMTIYAFLTKLGVPSSALLAIFGSAGLAIGLALKDTLGNIASGIMLLTLRPVKVGEFIDTPNFAGTVQEIGLFATVLKNTEGVFIYVPNGQVWNARMTNFGRHTERRLLVDIGVGYDTDLEKAKAILLGVMNDNVLTLQMPAAPECHVMSFGDSAIILSCRCWLPAADWLKSASDMRIALKAALDAEAIEIPYPQRVVRTRAG